MIKGKFSFFVFILSLAFINTFQVFGQQRECFTDQYLQEEIKINPRRLEILNQIEKHVREYEKSIKSRNNTIVNIPVVVHVVYNTADENLSDDQIRSQIDVLNKDFRRKNTDINNLWPQASDTGIEFCLASRDPQGKSTNGITRTYSNISSFSTTGNEIKFSRTGGKDAWPSDNYLNIWVCDITGTVLGYAQYPGGNINTDGVVIDYKVFGTGTKTTFGFHLGRTTTHEVGHWLNLKHIWGSSDCSTDDLVSDTPKSDAPNYGCAKGHWSCGSLDMVENYMDYSNDECMNLFTIGQKDRMKSLFATGGSRYSITLSDGCKPPVSANAFCGKTNLEITFDNYPQETSWEIKTDKGIIVVKSKKYLSAQKNTSVKIDTCLSEGCYAFFIYDSYNDGICCSSGSGSYKITVDGKIIGSGGKFGKSASHEFCVTKPIQITCSDGIKNGTETGIDCGGISCPPCPTCTDGLKNGNETGVDCGGSGCPSCPTCTDGIKNGTETGIDCGGSGCPACPTCTDGIKNGTETGIDCGGTTCKPCQINNGGFNSANLVASYFETGWDNWTGGATDTERYFGDFSWEGDYSIMIRDNTGDESAMTSKSLDLRSFAAVKIEFAFYAYSMEKDEDFWLMYHDGTKWQTLKAYVSQKDFYNNHFYEVTFIMDASRYSFAQNGKFRFQCDASTNADEIYIDAVKITGIPKGARINDRDQILSVGYYVGAIKNQDEEVEILITPNPGSDYISITTGEIISNIKILGPSGKVYKNIDQFEDGDRIDITGLPSGVYIVNIETSNTVISKRVLIH